MLTKGNTLSIIFLLGEYRNELPEGHEMKKIINGKKYDTDTATKIAFRDVNTFRGHSCHIYSNDFGYWSQSLYLKKTGEFFITGDSVCPSFDPISGSYGLGPALEILPVSELQARQFVENSDDDYEEIFGVVEE